MLLSCPRQSGQQADSTTSESCFPSATTQQTAQLFSKTGALFGPETQVEVVLGLSAPDPQPWFFLKKGFSNFRGGGCTTPGKALVRGMHTHTPYTHIQGKSPRQRKLTAGELDASPWQSCRRGGHPLPAPYEQPPCANQISCPRPICTKLEKRVLPSRVVGALSRTLRRQTPARSPDRIRATLCPTST